MSTDVVKDLEVLDGEIAKVMEQLAALQEKRKGLARAIRHGVYNSLADEIEGTDMSHEALVAFLRSGGPGDIT